MFAEGQGIGVLGVGLVDGQFHAAHAVLFTGADGHGGAVASKDDRVGGHAGFHGPGKAQVGHFLGVGLAGADGDAVLVRGVGTQEVGIGEDAVHERFLHHDAAVGQALDVQEGGLRQLVQAAQAGQFHDAQVLAALEDLHGAFFIGRSGHHFEIAGGHHLGGLTGEGAVDHHRAAESGDAVAPEGLVQGSGHAAVVPGSAAGVVVLEDDGRGALAEVLQDVGAVVHVGEVGLAGVFAGLDHLGFGHGRNDALTGATPAQAAAGDATFTQFIQGSGLVGVFAVAQTFFLVVQGPDALVVHKLFVTQQNGHGLGKSVLVDFLVHGLQVGRHDASRYA